jgi:hypothetical protein
MVKPSGETGNVKIQPILVILGVFVLTGCPGSTPKGDLPTLQPAKGKVLRGGQPVNGGSIKFHAEGGSLDLVVGGEVNADGSFELQTMHAQSMKKASGAPVGRYKVTYFPALGDQTAGPNPAPIELPDTVTIKDGPNDIPIEVGKKK